MPEKIEALVTATVGILSGGAGMKLFDFLLAKRERRDIGDATLRGELWDRVELLEERLNTQSDELQECRDDRAELRAEMTVLRMEVRGGAA